MKRRVFALTLCILMFLGCAVSVRADNAASGIQIYVTVTSDGDADVTMSVRLRLEEEVASLSFPLPLGATDVRLNDGGVNATKMSSCLMVDLGSAVRNYTGTQDLSFRYRLPDVVKMVDNKMMLNLPLLSGFEYPVESVNLTVMLPDTVQGRPVFKSTYHLDDIDSILSTAINNNVITGLITTPLKDRETLSMSLAVQPEMFGGVSTYVRVGNPELIPMSICAALALLYWIIFLRCYPMLRERRATPPEGITAGELGSRLCLAGGDLTMMVFSWAQLGYILIHMDDEGRVTLHKRMEMGNERSAFEVKIFQTLFGNRRYIDGTGNSYAMLARRVSAAVPGKKTLCNPKSGNVKLFRWLSCGVLLFAGWCFAMNITGIWGLQVILALALAGFGVLSAWFIQEGMYRIHLRYKLPLIVSIALSVIWIGLGIWAGQLLMAVLCVLAQWLAGLAAAYGGRRTELGRLNSCQILGFRHYLKTVSKEDLNRIQSNDPEYFFNTIPFAMALGVPKAFAKRFGRRKLPPCPYFHCGVSNRMEAEDWVSFLSEAADILDYRQRQMEIEKFSPIQFGR